MLINRDPFMKRACRRCLTAFSSEQVLSGLVKRCIKQKPADICFSWRNRIVFEDNNMEILLQRNTNLPELKQTNKKAI